MGMVNSGGLREYLGVQYSEKVLISMQFSLCWFVPNLTVSLNPFYWDIDWILLIELGPSKASGIKIFCQTNSTKYDFKFRRVNSSFVTPIL